MELVCIVAVAQNGVIGRDQDLPWRQQDDLRRFKQITMGAPLLMGRKNHESIGRCLPGRENLVISRNYEYKGLDGAIVCPTLESALHWCLLAEVPRAFLIGGGQLYAEGLDYCDRLILTEIMADVEGDVFFQWDPSQWKEVRCEEYPADEKNQYPVRYRELERIAS